MTQHSFSLAAKCICGLLDCPHAREHAAGTEERRDDALANQVAADNGWTFRRWETTSDLFGTTAQVAVFMDGRREVRRTLAEMRASVGA